MLVVIAIIGIVCVLALPSLMGSIKKAKEAKVLTNGRSIYTTLLSEMAEHSSKELTKEEIAQLSEVPGEILKMTFTDDQLDTLLYKEEDLIAKYENGKWSMGTEDYSSDTNYFDGNNIMDRIASALETCDNDRLGSMSGNGVKELRDNNIDLEGNGIKTWYYDKSKGLLALSPQDFNKEQQLADESQPFILYNYNSNQYEVKNVEVETQKKMLILDENYVDGGGTFSNYQDALSSWEKITQ